MPRFLALDARSEGLEHAPIGDDPFVLAAAPGHRLMKSASPASPSVLDGATGAHEAGLSATGLSTLVQMVGAGTGVTLLPRMAVAVENRRGQLAVRSFKSPAPTRSLILAWRRGSALRSPLAALAAVLRTGVGDLYRTTATPRR